MDLSFSIGAKPILVKQARLAHDSNSQFNGIVRNVANKKGAILINASEPLSGKDWAFYDQVHFDLEGRGSEAMSQLMAEYIKEVLVWANGKEVSP